MKQEYILADIGRIGLNEKGRLSEGRENSPNGIFGVPRIFDSRENRRCPRGSNPRGTIFEKNLTIN